MSESDVVPIVAPGTEAQSLDKIAEALGVKVGRLKRLELSPLGVDAKTRAFVYDLESAKIGLVADINEQIAEIEKKCDAEKARRTKKLRSELGAIKKA